MTDTERLAQALREIDALIVKWRKPHEVNGLVLQSDRFRHECAAELTALRDKIAGRQREDEAARGKVEPVAPLGKPSDYTFGPPQSLEQMREELESGTRRADEGKV